MKPTIVNRTIVGVAGVFFTAMAIIVMAVPMDMFQGSTAWQQIIGDGPESIWEAFFVYVTFPTLAVTGIAIVYKALVGLHGTINWRSMFFINLGIFLLGSMVAAFVVPVETIYDTGTVAQRLFLSEEPLFVKILVSIMMLVAVAAGVWCFWVAYLVRRPDPVQESFKQVFTERVLH